MKIEEIISSLLKINEMVEQLQQRCEVIQQTFNDVKNIFEDFRTKLQWRVHLSTTPTLCVAGRRRTRNNGSRKRGSESWRKFSALWSPFPTVTSIHLTNYFLFSSFMSVAPSTNDSLTIKGEHLAVRWKFDPGEIDFQFFDSSPSPQNNSHTMFQHVDLSHSQFSCLFEEQTLKKCRYP